LLLVPHEILGIEYFGEKAGGGELGFFIRVTFKFVTAGPPGLSVE